VLRTRLHHQLLLGQVPQVQQLPQGDGWVRPEQSRHRRRHHRLDGAAAAVTAAGAAVTLAAAPQRRLHHQSAYRMSVNWSAPSGQLIAAQSVAGAELPLLLLPGNLSAWSVPGLLGAEAAV